MQANFARQETGEKFLEFGAIAMHFANNRYSRNTFCIRSNFAVKDPKGRGIHSGQVRCEESPATSVPFCQGQESSAKKVSASIP